MTSQSNPTLFTGIDPEHWINLAWLAGAEALARTAGRNTLSLVTESGRLVKARHGQRGPLPDLRASAAELSDLAALARREAVDFVLAIERDFPERIVARAQERLLPGMDLAAQGAILYQAGREEFGHSLRAWPEVRWPEPNFRGLNVAVKTLLPAGETIVGVIYSDDGSVRDRSGLPIVSSGIYRFGAGPRLELIATTAALVPAGLTVVDWRRDYRRVNDLARAAWGKVFLGAHLPLSVLPELMAAAEAGSLPARLLELNRQGRIILDPFPLRLRALLKMGNFLK